MTITRRDFLKTSAAAGAGMIAGSGFTNDILINKPPRQITITEVDSNFEREPLIRPFGFKGGYMNEIWQSAVMLQSASGIRKVGICTQSILWSDAQVFAAHSESGGNSLMYAMTEYGSRLLKGVTFTDPVALLDEIWPKVFAYGKKICGKDDLRQTFALNALVGVDNAVWLLYAAENGITTFDNMIPAAYKPSLSHHHKKVASIPLMAYSIPIAEIKDAVDNGYFFMKIKIGQPGTQEEMLQKDMVRLTEIHKSIGTEKTQYSENGKLPYYFDANGRYEKKETLLRLIDHAKKIGAFDQIAIIEEPFDEYQDIDITDIPVRIAADESAHTDKDTLKRIQMGYKAIALKAIAKTLSMTMKIAQVAHNNNVPCFCADLTINPILVEWNKNVAARLAPFPGLGLGLCETNGHQNYKNWETMRNYHPDKDASWAQTKEGVFELNDDYYTKSGGIFMPSKHYEEMFQKKSSS
jgi:L-alanine-DL-glutamate epimerase-like enolase superfamily enzyme